MPSEKVRHYIRRAADFLAGMQLMRNEQPYRNSTALLAVHSAVSYADALRVGLGDESLAADDHRKTSNALQQLIPAKLLADRSGLGHLDYLIANKSSVAYQDERLTALRSEKMAIKAERFAAWADRAGRQLGIGGWQHDDQ